MAQVNFRVDDELKIRAEKVCEDMGMNMTTALNIFLVKLTKERRIPFDVTADPDPFYSEEHIEMLERRIADIKAGRSVHEHELIEDDNFEIAECGSHYGDK